MAGLDAAWTFKGFLCKQLLSAVPVALQAPTTQARLATEDPPRRSSDSGLSLDLWMDVQLGNSKDVNNNAEVRQLSSDETCELKCRVLAFHG